MTSADQSERPRCPRDSGWCDGALCRDYGIDCPNADPEDMMDEHYDGTVKPRWRWRFKGTRQWIALRLAPWLDPARRA